MHPPESKLERAAATLAWQLLRHHQAEDTPDSQRRWLRWVLLYYIAHWDPVPDVVPGVGLLDDYLLLHAAVAWTGAPEVAVPDDQDVLATRQIIEESLRGKVEWTAMLD